MRVYHFLSAKWGLAAIRDRRLKIARIGALNDPFEFLSLTMRDAEDRIAFSLWRNDLDKDLGLLCFSERATNPVQWSHYAENHTGVCLGFEAPAATLMKVRYTSKRGRVDVREVSKVGGEAEEQMMVDALSTKYSHWRYEAEWRTFIELDHDAVEHGLYFQSFGPNFVLRQVIVGPKSTITRADVAEAIGDMQDVEAYQARLAFQSFKVVKNRNPKLWA
jgi:hypothetical protein